MAAFEWTRFVQQWMMRKLLRKNHRFQIEVRQKIVIRRWSCVHFLSGLISICKLFILFKSHWILDKYICVQLIVWIKTRTSSMIDSTLVIKTRSNYPFTLHVVPSTKCPVTITRVCLIWLNAFTLQSRCIIGWVLLILV